MNIEELVQEAKQGVFNKQLVGMRTDLLLGKTEEGKFSHTWEADYLDGKTVRQFDDITFVRALRDPHFTPIGLPYISTDAIERPRLKEFRLHPIALTRFVTPWHQTVFRIRPRYHLGEQLVARWEVDFSVVSQKRLYRHTIGIRLDRGEILTVISLRLIS